MNTAKKQFSKVFPLRKIIGKRKRGNFLRVKIKAKLEWTTPSLYPSSVLGIGRERRALRIPGTRSLSGLLMRPISPTRTHPYWIGLRPVKLVIYLECLSSYTFSILFVWPRYFKRNGWILLVKLGFSSVRDKFSLSDRIQLLHDANTVCNVLVDNANDIWDLRTLTSKAH